MDTTRAEHSNPGINTNLQIVISGANVQKIHEIHFKPKYFLSVPENYENNTDPVARCHECNAGGTVICCDTCSLTFHVECLPDAARPKVKQCFLLMPNEAQSLNINDKVNQISANTIATNTTDVKYTKKKTDTVYQVAAGVEPWSCPICWQRAFEMLEWKNLVKSTCIMFCEYSKLKKNFFQVNNSIIYDDSHGFLQYPLNFDLISKAFDHLNPAIYPKKLKHTKSKLKITPITTAGKTFNANDEKGDYQEEQNEVKMVSSKEAQSTDTEGTQSSKPGVEGNNKNPNCNSFKNDTANDIESNADNCNEGDKNRNQDKNSIIDEKSDRMNVTDNDNENYTYLEGINDTNVGVEDNEKPNGNGEDEDSRKMKITTITSDTEALSKKENTTECEEIAKCENMDSEIDTLKGDDTSRKPIVKDNGENISSITKKRNFQTLNSDKTEEDSMNSVKKNIYDRELELCRKFVRTSKYFLNEIINYDVRNINNETHTNFLNGTDNFLGPQHNIITCKENIFSRSSFNEFLHQVDVSEAKLRCDSDVHISVGKNFQIPKHPNLFIVDPVSGEGEDKYVTGSRSSLVYSPYLLDKYKDEWVKSYSDMQSDNFNDYLDDYIKQCARRWRSGPGWQPFNPEYAYKLLHHADYNPNRALQLLNSASFCFELVCGPPVRKYENKWRPKDKRGGISQAPYPSPMTIRSYLSRRPYSSSYEFRNNK